MVPQVPEQGYKGEPGASSKGRLENMSYPRHDVVCGEL